MVAAPRWWSARGLPAASVGAGVARSAGAAVGVEDAPLVHALKASASSADTAMNAGPAALTLLGTKLNSKSLLEEGHKKPLRGEGQV